MSEFPLFGQLPVELQQAIWLAAIPRLPPTVYPATIQVQPQHMNEDDGQNHDNAVLPARLYNAVERGRSNSEFHSAASSLLVCCKLASRVATRAYQDYKPESPIFLRNLPHEIDGHCDLLMFLPGWQASCAHWGGLVLTENPPRCTLYNLSVLWPGPQAKRFWSWHSFVTLMHFWLSLRSFYVVVDPKHLVPKQWLPEKDRHWPGTGIVPPAPFLSTCMSNYRHDYEQRKPQIFFDKDRQYFEVSPEILAEAGQLEEVAEVLWHARNHIVTCYQELPGFPVRCLVLSWREI